MSKAEVMMEVLADISYVAGEHGFSTGDSRLDVSLFIEWAKEWADRIYDKDVCYLSTYKFAYQKIADYCEENLGSDDYLYKVLSKVNESLVICDHIQTEG